MKQKIVAYGTTVDVTVRSADEKLILVVDANKEGYILAGHGVKKRDLPAEGDQGRIVFTRGGPMGGYWKFIANKVD
jgi:hypothetical protein